MSLQNSQNKSNSESNITKNSTQPCCSKSGKCRVEKLVRKYECLTVRNIRSRCCGEQYVKQCGEMDSVPLNKINVQRFFSLEEKVSDKNSNKSDTMFKKSNSKLYTKNEEKKTFTPSTSQRKDDVFSRFFGFEEKSRKEASSSTLPNRKKEEVTTKSVARSVSATIKDKKFKYLSTNQDNKFTKKQDGGIVQSRISVFNSTGTVPKQTNVEEVTYRKRRESYVLATQDPDFQKYKIQPETPKRDPEKEEIPRRSYVEKTVSKFENDCFTIPKKKFEQSLNQLFQQYHDKKMGTSDKMTREELNIEIDNVLLNKFKHISRDSSPEADAGCSGNHIVSQPQISTTENTEQETVEQNDRENEHVTEGNVDTEYVIIVKNTDEETSDVIRTSNLFLDSDDNCDNQNILRGSVENLCDDLKKVISDVSVNAEIKGIYVSSENMVENNDFEEPNFFYDNLKNNPYENEAHKLQEAENQEDISDYEHVLYVNDNLEFEVRDAQNKPVKKVPNLISFFSDIISDNSTNKKSETSLNRISLNFQDIEKNELQNKESDSDSINSQLSNNLEQNNKPEIQIDDEVNSNSSTESFQINIQKRNSSRHINLPSNRTSYTEESTNRESAFSVGNISEISATNYNTDTSRLALQEKNNLLQTELSNIVKTHSFKEQKVRPKSVNIFRTSSAKDESKRYSFLQYVHKQNKLFNKEETTQDERKTVEKSESFRSQNDSNPSSANVSRNSSFKEEKKRNSFLHRKNSDQSQTQETEQGDNPRLSRLYSGKFKRNTAQVTNKQDTNNNTEQELNTHNIKKENDTERIIYNQILNDTEYYSDSDGDYSYSEAYNPNFDLHNEHSTCEWVKNTIEHIDRIRMVEKMFKKEDVYENNNNEENLENIYENLRINGSTDTIHVICDEDNIPVIRMSMMDLAGDYVTLMQIEEMKIKKSEKELMKNIDEIRDNTKKACLINELITTEKSYINNSLYRLAHDYMPEMDKDDIPKGLLGKCRQIFGNADLLYEGHKEKFLPELENYTCIEDIGQAFLNNETIFKYYPLYSKNKPKSDIVMKDHNYYFEAKQKELKDKLDLASYLLTPIQRLAKYCQLVGSLVKECEKEQIECHKLKAAHEMLSKQMRMGNDLIALDAIVGFTGSILDQGELLLRDVFTVYPPNKKPPYEGMIFLFQRCLMITAINRQDYKESFVYKESFELTDMGYSDFAPLEFSVWFRKRDCNMYKFVTKSSELKEKWIKEIFNLLWKQLEANKKRRKKELEANGFVVTKIPIVQTRPFSVPNKETTKSIRKNTMINSSTNTVWYR